MATPLDIGLLVNFKIIFPFLLVFCIVYAVLTYTKIFGENNAALNAVIALVLGMMTLFSDLVTDTINLAAPWFVLLIIFSVFILLGLMAIGIKEGDIIATIRNPEYTYITIWVIALVLVIVLGSLSQVMAEKKGGYGPYAPGGNATMTEGTVDIPEQESDFWKTLFHPKVLGMLALLLISFFTISKLTTPK